MKNTWCVLLVEDDVVLGPLTLESLLVIGHVGTLASSASSAYGHLSNKHGFEIMLLDLQLGDERGEDIIHRLRKEGIKVPRIVVLSAQPDAELKRSARSIEARGYLQKPKTISEIHQGMIAAMA
jgi:DNA-binding response OmpR family regulator